jgi:hypothetical protein
LLRVHLDVYEGSGTCVDVFDSSILYREYDACFKGKKQLHWSRGFRDLLGLGEEQTDEELAEGTDEITSLFASIPLNIWKEVLRKERRGQLLEVCKLGEDALYDFLIELVETDMVLSS